MPSSYSECAFIVLLTSLCLFELATCDVLRYDVMEEVQPDTKVGDVRLDAGLYQIYQSAQVESFAYRHLDPKSKSAQLFTVSNTSGTIRTRDQLDRETICPNQAKCEVKVDVVYMAADLFNVISVIVEVTDINDNAPVFPLKTVALVIPESAPPGGTYNLPLARDIDTGDHGVKSYVLQSKVTNFELKVIRIGNNDFPTSLQLQLVERVDRELTPFYQVVVVATDGGKIPKSGSLTINITVADANDHGPSFPNDTTHVRIPEDQPLESRVLRLYAHDPDIGDNGRILYKLVAGAADSSLGVFQVVENTGELMLVKKLDYGSKHNYHLVVEARDGGVNSQPAYINVIIEVEDINNNAPQISINTKNATSDVAHISELVEAGKFIAHISVHDPDTGSGGSFECQIDDAHFQLQKIKNGQYKVVTVAMLDHEEKSQYQIHVACADNGVPQLISEKIITVKVKDENDNAPIFSRATFSVTFPENNYLNQYITQVNATDLDMGINAVLIYELGLEGREMFSVDARTGVIRANGVFDYEKEKMYIFPVVAKDGGKPTRSGSALVSVSISDKNDEAPSFSKTAYVFDVLENQPVGMEIGILSAVDLDSDVFNVFEFELASSPAAHNFAVDPKTGHVRTRAVLNREQQAVYHMVVRAVNVGPSPVLSGSALVTVNVLDQNDHMPIIDYPNEHNYTVHISTHVPEGYLVGLIQAHDLDTGSNARLSFAITDGNQDNTFSIEPALGALSTRRALSHVGNKLYDMKITVYDHGFPAKYSTATLHVVLNSSLAYPSGANPAKLLSGTNVTIVISLAVASAIVVIVLVVAIVIIRKKEVDKRKRNPMYRCQIETKTPPSVENVNEKVNNGGLGLNIKPPGGPRNVHNNGGGGSLGKSAGKKEVSFNMLPNGKQLNTDKAGSNNHPSTTVPKGKYDTQYKLEAIPGGEDSDSAYSGDVSNTDSGRGPSEEGEVHAQGGPFYTPASGKHPQSGAVTAGTTPLSHAHVDTLRLHNHKSQQPQPNNKLYSTPPKHPGGSRHPADHTRHQQHPGNKSANPMDVPPRATSEVRPPSRCNTPQKPLPPPRKSSSTDNIGGSGGQSQGGVQYPHRHHHHHPHPHQPHNGYHGDWRVNNNSVKNQWDTVHEDMDDDDESSTSGSYIVDPTDLYLDGSQPAVMV